MTTFREGYWDARNKQWNKMSDKAILKAQRRHNRYAILRVVSKVNAEAMLSRGWEMINADGLPTIFSVNQTYTMRYDLEAHTPVSHLDIPAKSA